MRTHPASSRLRLSAHARRRLTERQLWPALGAISFIAYRNESHRYGDLSTDGRRVERIETESFVIVVARAGTELTLLTAFAKGETGPRACARFTAAAAELRRSVLL
jgi:hypothetical protein